MKSKFYIKRYLLICLTLLCGSYTVMAQNNVTSDKIIESVSYEEIAGALSIVNYQGDIYRIQRSQIDASIIVNEQARSIELETTNEATQNLNEGVVILNVDGVTILTSSEGSSSSYYYSGTTDNSSNKSYTYTTSSPTQTATTSSEYASTTTTSSSSDYDYDYDYIESSYSYNKVFEPSILIGGGIMFEDETVTLANVQLRGALRVFSGFKVAVSVSGDAYIFPPYTGFNYYSDSQQYLYMATAMVGVEFSLSSLLDSSVFPSKVLADVGYGYSVTSEGFKGYTVCPGLVWDILEVNDSSIYTVLSYKHQQFTSNSYGGSLMISVGYKF